MSDSIKNPMDRLIDIMATLRDPQVGCPWDVAQSFESVAPYTIEEAYEVADAIARKDMEDLKDELGDLLFQVVFHARMAEEQGSFDFDAVVLAVYEKMIRRHPHVFGDTRINSADDQIRSWEKLKQTERKKRADRDGRAEGILDDVAQSLPAMMRAVKLQKRAARVGFDWNEPHSVIAKIREELEELEQTIINDESNARQREELGDLLFSCANLARFVQIDPEDALLAANRKFERRFRSIEHALKDQGRALEEASLEEMEALWNAAKLSESAGDAP